MTTQGGSGGVLIVDFGAQYCQLIARRVRELGVFSRITVPERALFTLDSMRPHAIILSGGPCSVYHHDAPELSAEILDRGVPILGICYGLQWLAQHLGGEVTPAEEGHEYGLIARLTEKGEAVAGALELAERVARNAPLAVAASKQLIQATQGITEEDFWKLQGPMQQSVFSSNDAKEGPKAFAEKRPPEWTGS